MRRRVVAGIILAIGVGLMVAPAAFSMWSRAPRGAQMIDGFRPIMTAKNVPVIAGYGRTVLGGFGDAPQVVQDAAQHFSGGHVKLSYQQATAFIQKQTDLGGLAYLQKELPTLGPPFSTFLSILYKDQPYFSGMAGLPNFELFPLFFVIPGLLIALGALRFLRRDGSADAGGHPVTARRPARFLAVMGLLVLAAPFLPMPPGFHSIRTVGPHGAAMLADFASPLNGSTPPAVMSLATVRQFDRYVSEMHAAAPEIVYAVQDASMTFAHRSISAAEAKAFLAADPSLTLANTLATGFEPMYREFHGILTTMALDMADYQAVQALPSFALFPYFFVIPGALVLLLALIGLRGEAPIRGGGAAPPDPYVALAFAGVKRREDPS